MPAPLTRLNLHLSDFAPGQRAWFWFCPGASAPLVVSPFDTDPAMHQLRQLASRAEKPANARPIIGLMSLAEDGRMDIAAPHMTKKHLSCLARWVRDSVSACPGLGILKDARGRILDENFQVIETFERESLWEGVPSVTPPGTTAASAAVLAALAPGQRAWFWATLAGPAGRPLLLATSHTDDPDLDMLNYEVRNAAKRCGKIARSLQGIVTRQADGTLLVTSSETPARLERLVASFTAEDGLSELTVVACDGAVLDLSPQVSALSALESQDVLFWFHSDGTQTSLHLSTDPAALKKAARVASGGKTLRGRLVRSQRGWLEFRSRDDMPDFLGAVASWAAENASQWPALRSLKGARMTVRDRDNNVIARHKADSAWANL